MFRLFYRLLVGLAALAVRSGGSKGHRDSCFGINSQCCAARPRRSSPNAIGLTGQWLLGKKLHLATSTYRGHERNVQLHVLPTLGKVSIRRLRYQQIEALYDSLLQPYRMRGVVDLYRWRAPSKPWPAAIGGNRHQDRTVDVGPVGERGCGRAARDDELN